MKKLRNRNNRVVVYFDKDELERLTKKVRKAHLSREGFIRKAVNETEIREAPGVDVMLLLREMRCVGYNVDQILKRMNSAGILDLPEFRKNLEALRAAARMVEEAYAHS